MIKNILKKFFPATMYKVDARHEQMVRLIKSLFKNQGKQLTEDNTRIVDLNRQIIEQNKMIIEQNQLIRQQEIEFASEFNIIRDNMNDIREMLNITSNYLRENEKKNNTFENTLKTQHDNFAKTLNEIKKASDEAVWGLTFHDSIKDTDWLIKQEFYPGRWAVGYQYLYVLYRVLNSVKPKSILELGLGQSTRMITQYAASDRDVKHRVTEHDEDWINFFQKENQLSNNTEIVRMELTHQPYEDDESVLMYDKFMEKLSDRRYDLISVDAPFGGSANIYARVDTIALFMNNLEESFIIMIDDANRPGENHTIQLMKKELDRLGKEYECGRYMGNKTTYVIASPDKKFVCSL